MAHGLTWHDEKICRPYDVTTFIACHRMCYPRGCDLLKLFIARKVNPAAAQATIPWNLLSYPRTSTESRAWRNSLWAMARESRLATKGFFPKPLPIIGVRHALMQSRAHDDHRSASREFLPPFPARAAPLREKSSKGGGSPWDSGTPGLRCRWHRHRSRPRPVGLRETLGTGGGKIPR